MKTLRTNRNSANSPLKKRYKTIIAIIFLLIYTITLTNINTKPVNAVEGEILEQAKELVQDYYYYPVSEETLKANSIEEMLKNMGDPYSSYFTKVEFDDFVNSIDNKFTGIGIQFRLQEEGVEIVKVMDGSPAKEAGLQIGDVILKADNTILKGLKEEQIGALIKGFAGTTVNLVIQRDNITKEYNVERREISMPTVTYTVLKSNIGYIIVDTFGETTGDEFTEALKVLRNMKAKSFIVDLRYNTGGYINPALDIAGHFVGFKPIVQMENKNGFRYKYYGTGYQDLIKEPTIFLINDYSASASEILSSAIKDYKKAGFIGINTYGKGVAQSMYYLNDGSVLKLTTNQFFSPLGNTIQKVGIRPDLEVPEEDIDSLDLAYLLLIKASDYSTIEALKDKSSFIKIVLNDIPYYIDLNEARKDENWESYKEILKKINKSQMFIGSGEKWVNLRDFASIDDAQGFYPYSELFKDIKKVKNDTTIIINFNNTLVKESITDNNIELINSETGERIATTQELNNNKLTLKLKKQWEAGKTYYLVLHKELMSISGKNLTKDVLGKITINN
ncbi:carboxy-terminal processing protease CtpB precursor [Clostridium homopropionicum DSM 5847]|uniref:Carboxy-terminal processing protease CtpB n=1 Tax=Clostridium homopropionicum DSM 5847 TaxID=1121318 RepID=A0A0L6ZCA0_9CLOT|nr:S41 family peptidase [Clostridium homopropionicum]KOA20591.1 carboxy-terminal processing protease CtpB precursor [Clostridium homopropionicum DSM 5847]SFF93667.1 carboxyl-terminal processing protease [Clostridium homopropionicum]